MQSSRRGFMKLLGSLPVVGPSIAKEAANIDLLKAPAINMAGKISSGFMDTDYDIDDDVVKLPKILRQKAQLKALIEKSKYLRKKGIPVFEKAQWDHDYRCKALDPDLAVNRSMSLVAKLSIQKQRDWKHEEERLIGMQGSIYGILNDMYYERLKKMFGTKSAYEYDHDKNENSDLD